MIYPWQEDEVARMRALAGQGMSAGQIAARLKIEFGTGRSRSAVVGKIMRGNGQFGRLLGRSGSAKQTLERPQRRARVETPQPSAAIKPQAVPPRPAPPVANLPAPLPISFLDAMFSDRCLHFVGDPLGPSGPDMPVCGAERAQFAPAHSRYCARHLASVVRAPEAVAA